MKRITINHPNAVKIFIEALNNKKVIAYPTDTIYGLGTAINNEVGIDRINKIKKRNQPMSIALGNFELIKKKIIANSEMMNKIEEILLDGSTCIMPYQPGSFNEKITQNGQIGFRIPNHNFLKKALSNYKKAITTTSINETGLKPLYIPDEIEEKFGNVIDLFIEDGEIKNNPSKIFIFEKNKIKRIR